MKVYVLLKTFEYGDNYQWSTNTSIVGVYSDVPYVPDEEKTVEESGMFTYTSYEVVESVLSNLNN